MSKTDIIQQLADHLLRKSIQNMVVLTDENVERHYPDYFSELSGIVCMDKIVIAAGDRSKSIETAIRIWQYLAEKQYDKETFLLNFGGGMTTDIGGFVASTYKRGISFANVPTTLLAMIDAAVGGKTGINLPNMKNGVGTIYFPDIQLPVDLSFLDTLHIDEIYSGLGELTKYALVGSASLFCSLRKRKNFPSLTMEDVDFCIDFKANIVREDPYDKGIRHILNFGHTIGHAIESWQAAQGTPLPHGIAVAQGIFYESLLSMRLGLLPQEDWQQIAEFLPKHFQIPDITPEILKQLLPYMQNDKKNHNGTLNFTLLDHIGHACPNFQIAESGIYDLIS